MYFLKCVKFMIIMIFSGAMTYANTTTTVTTSSYDVFTSLESLTFLLGNATYALNTSNTILYTTINYPDTTSFNRACSGNVGFGSYDNMLSSHSLFPNISVNDNITIFKQINNKTPLNIINAINALTPTWKTNLNNMNHSTWQYVGSKNVFGIYPAFSWQGCSDSVQYFPPSRPWYTSSTIGKGNYVFFIDITSGKDPAKFLMLINLLVTFINSLSFYDYFNVISYDVLGNKYSDFLQQGTSINKANAINWVNSLSNDGLPSTTIGTVITKGLELLNMTKTDGSTSNCHNYFVMFSQGDSSINTPHPYDVINNSYNNITVSTYMSNYGYYGHIFDGIACLTSGFVANVTSNPVEDMLKFNEYYSSRIKITIPRYSEVYEDAFGLGLMTTAGIPVYYSNGSVIAVNAIDIVTASVNMSTIDINTQLQKIQQCEAITVDDINNKTCPDKEGIGEGESEADLSRNKNVLFGCGITFSLLFVWCIGILTSIRYSDKIGSLWWLGGTIALIVFWVSYGVYIYDDQVKVDNWKETKQYTTGTNILPYACTRTINCECSDYQGISCNQANNVLLAPGSLSWSMMCQTGYHCCRTRTYCSSWGRTCTSRCSNQQCSTVCVPYCYNWVTECIQHVNYRQCTEERGICHKAFVNVEFKISGGLQRLVKAKNCGLNDTMCATDFIDSYPKVGNSKNIWYNPWNPTETEDSVGYNKGAWVMIALVCVYFISISIVVIYMEYRKNKCCIGCCENKNGMYSVGHKPKSSIKSSSTDNVPKSMYEVSKMTQSVPKNNLYNKSYKTGVIYPSSYNQQSEI
jgi:hypothetical protein